ncbi:hypothetical protein AVEN_167272-1 [Araneus ventricosus]|uniref:Peptidase A9 domain-containing protein n=1 Tax=Araneus ventricosus TaxID=182803 RepID=A0A4Y2HG07_ARAVE|nr:hypothetical protein AVEN_167272-1 [Araneus ventricosus]
MHWKNRRGSAKLNPCVKLKLEKVESEVQRKIEGVEEKVQRKIEESKGEVQEMVGNLERRINELEERPKYFPASPEFMSPQPTVKPLTFDGQTKWTVFKTQFDVYCWKEHSSAKLERDLLEVQQERACAEGVPGDYFEPGKLTYVCLAGRRLPSLNKATEEGSRVSSLSGKKNGLYLEGSICGIQCLMMVDTGANVTLLTTDLAQKLKEQFIYTAPNISLKPLLVKKQKYEANWMHPMNVGQEDFITESTEFQKFLDSSDIPSQVSQKVVLVAATLVHLEREAIPIRVLNLNNKPKILDKGDIIATCEPVVDIITRSQEFSGAQHLPSTLENLEIFNEEQRTAVRKLLKEFQNLFSTCDANVGHCIMTQHRINVGDHPPIKLYPRRLPLARKEADNLVKGMVDNRIIEELFGPCASNIVLVKKKDGSTRFCVDYRKLNEITKKGSTLYHK